MHHEVTAKPIKWEKDAYPDEYWDCEYGFHIQVEPEDENEDRRFVATWGDGEPESFPTLKKAQQDCQRQIDEWVASIAVVTPTQPQEE